MRRRTFAFSVAVIVTGLALAVRGDTPGSKQPPVVSAANPERVVVQKAIPQPPSEPIDVNDISYLWPVPTTPQDVANLISLDEKRPDGSPILSKEAFDALIANALKVSVNGSSGGSNQIKFPAQVSNDFQQPKTWKIAAIRIDPSAPGTSPLLAKTIGTIPQIRLIAQPVTVKGNVVTVHDTTAHLVFSYTLNANIPFQPDKSKFAEILGDLIDLKRFLQEKNITTKGPLGIHPGLRTPIQGFPEKVKNLLLKHLDEKKLSAMAFMGLNTPEPWIFFALARNDRGWALAPNGSFPGTGAQMFTRRGGDPVSPNPLPSNLDGKRGVSTAQLFAPGIEQKLDSLVFADRADLKMKDIPDLIANPLQSHFFNTDCVSCHTETIRRRFLNLENNVSSFKYTIPVGVSGGDPTTSPHPPWNVRNFGWGDVQGIATVSRRTANEAAAGAEFINKNYIAQPKFDSVSHPLTLIMTIKGEKEFQELKKFLSRCGLGPKTANHNGT